MQVCGDALRSARLRVFLAIALAGLGVQLAAPAAHAAGGGLDEVDIYDCPATIPANSVGVLMNDVECSTGTADFPKYGIVVGKNSQLALNGHTLSYVPSPSTDGTVLCVKACTVFDGMMTSPGGGAAVHVNGRGKLTVFALDITGFDYGLFAAQSAVNVSNTSITATVGGIWYTGPTTLDHVDVNPYAGATSLQCVDAASHSGKVQGHDVAVSGCLFGVYGARGVTLKNLTVTNSFTGVFSERKITLTDSSVTGSSPLSADIYGGSRPKLTNTTCGTSLRFFGKTGSGNWGVCAGD